GFIWIHSTRQPTLDLVRTSNRRRFFGINWSAAHLGPGTSLALLYDLHSSAVAKLVSERRIHYRRVFAGAGNSFYRQHCRIKLNTELVDNRRNSAVDLDRHLHGLSFCTSESARLLAKSVVAAAFGDSIADPWRRLAHTLCRIV